MSGLQQVQIRWVVGAYHIDLTHANLLLQHSAQYYAMLAMQAYKPGCRQGNLASCGHSGKCS